MQVRCVRAFGQLEPGDVAEVPDGAATDPDHFEPIDTPPPPRPAAAAAAAEPAASPAPAPAPAKEM